VGSGMWLVYAISFLAFIFVILPGTFLLAVALGRRWSHTPETLKKSFITLAYTLVPLGLAAWIAFSLSFVFANISYLWSAISDPLGAGWNLFGTAHATWTPYFTSIVPLLQVVVLIGGLAWASVIARRIAAETHSGGKAIRLAAPVMSFCFVVTVGLMGLLIG